MANREELEKLRKSLIELRAKETLYRHLADKEPEKYDAVNNQIKVVKRRIVALKSANAEKAKKGR